VNRRYRDFSRAKFQFEDALFNTTSQSYVETGVSITPEAGINVILFRANASAGSGVASPSLKAIYGEEDLGESIHNESVAGGHWNGIDLAGWKVVDCDGVSEVKLLARTNSSPTSVDVGAQQIISLPLGGWNLVLDTHYSLVQSEDTTEVDVTSVDVVIESLNFTVPTTGKYLVLWYAEAAMSEFPPGDGAYSIYGFVNDPGDSFPRRNSSNQRDAPGFGAQDDFHSWMWSEIRTISAGANTYTVKGRRSNGSLSVFVRRPRIIVISLDNVFEGTPQAGTTGTDTATQSNSFVENSVVDKTHNSASSEQVLVIANQTVDYRTPAHPSGGSNNNVATYKIRDNTDGVDYGTDSGERGKDWATNVIPTTVFALKEGALGDTDWKVYIREANNNGGWVTVSFTSVAVMGLTPKL
jgi:hypothetical protein